MSNSPEAEQKLSLESIDTGVSFVAAAESPDPKDLLEYERLEEARLLNALRRSRIKDVKADRKLRKKYANRILRYLEYYSIVVAVITSAAGFHVMGFSLEPEVLGALVGSTAVAAIGLVGFIARGLFGPPSR